MNIHRFTGQSLDAAIASRSFRLPSQPTGANVLKQSIPCCCAHPCTCRCALNRPPAFTLNTLHGDDGAIARLPINLLAQLTGAGSLFALGGVVDEICCHSSVTRPPPSLFPKHTCYESSCLDARRPPLFVLGVLVFVQSGGRLGGRARSPRTFTV